MLEVFDPTQGATKKAGKLAPRPQSLDGLTIGVIWNGRPVGTVILDAVIRIISSKYRIRDVVFHKKTFVGNSTPSEIVNDIAGKCQVVITGVGD